MRQADTTTYFILDGHQGVSVVNGWRIIKSTLRATDEGLSLAKKPSAPVPLKDAAGTFGELENPTGVAISEDGAVYVSDAAKHRIFRLVRRKGLQFRARFYQISGGRFDKDRFVYVPSASRLERWPGALGGDPQKFSEVEVQCETIWTDTEARRLVEAIILGDTSIRSEADDQSGKPCCGSIKTQSASECACPECSEPQNGAAASIEEWEDIYRPDFPTGSVCQPRIEYLPCLGGRGGEPRAFDEPRGLAVSPSGDLYVADSKNHRVQIFGLRGLVLKSIWGRRAMATDLPQAATFADCLPDEKDMVRLGQFVPGTRPGEFKEPWDVAVDKFGNWYVADKGNHRVQRFDCHTKNFQIFDGTVLAAHFFQTLHGPTAGARFVFIAARKRLERCPPSAPFTATGVTVVSDEIESIEAARRQVLTTINAAGADDILVEWDADYPAALAALHPEPAFDKPVHLAIDPAGRLFVVDESKDYVKVLDREGRVLQQVSFTSDVASPFVPAVVTISSDGKLLVAGNDGIHRFDFEQGRCAYLDHYSTWSGDCTGLGAAAGDILITGGGVDGVGVVKEPEKLEEVGVIIAGPLDSQIENCQWDRLFLSFQNGIPLGTSVTISTYTAAEEVDAFAVEALADDDWTSCELNAEDCLILSGVGRYLWLKIEFRGNGTDSPVLQRLKVYFPRLTYIQYLPAVYQADPISKDFLERFLSIFERTFSGFEEEIDGIARLFDADATPANGTNKDFLSWLAGWIDMIFLPGFSIETRRTLLRNAPELYRKRGTPAGLQLLLKLALDIDVRILEHFKLRRWLFLAGQSALGGRSELWGNCIVNRLQLDEYSRIGDFSLMGTGDPERDPFFVYAHKFSIFVEAASIRSAAIERMLRFLVDSEKPAHSQYTLEKTEPRFRVGMQSTLGLDTQVGAYPRLVLSQCSTLGYDALLGCDPQQKGPPIIHLGELTRVGVNAVVG
jgi:phage tail-like protein